MDAIFVDGVPAKITQHDFRRYHLQSFPQLEDVDYDDLILIAIDRVYIMFHGVSTLWDMHRKKQVWFDKTRECYLWLVAWLIADQYPDLTSISSVVGVIKRKRVDGVDIHFNTDRFKGDDPLIWLQSNFFGRMARSMMQTAPRRALLRVPRFV